MTDRNDMAKKRDQCCIKEQIIEVYTWTSRFSSPFFAYLKLIVKRY